MNKEIIIRRAKPKDFKQVHKLMLQVHKLHVKERNDIYKDVDPLDLDSFKEEISNNDNIYLVAEMENKIVGICFLQIKEISNNKIMKDRKILHIGSICVDEKNRIQGIGKKLYEEIVKIAKEKKVDSIELTVWGFNKNAIEFYKCLGMNIESLRFEQKMI